MWLTAVPVQAQDVAGEDETVGGTLPADTLVRDSLSLKWPQSAVPVSYKYLRAHGTGRNTVFRLPLEKQNTST